MKKWWVIALVFALALSLTSCSKKKNLEGYLYSKCDGNIGQFDVWGKKEGNVIKIRVIPLAVDGAGGNEPIVTIALTNSPAYRILVPEVAAFVNQQIPTELIPSDYDNYSRFVIAPAPPVGSDFNSQDPIDDAVCALPVATQQ